MSPQIEQKQTGMLTRAASVVRRILGRTTGDTTEEPVSAAAEPQRRASPATASRQTRREADIPLDVIGSAYTPPLTSSKASFRSDGSDHQEDQEFALGVADKDWNDEDHYTNKSGDPRIGTHRRTYEPGESQTESRTEKGG